MRHPIKTDRKVTTSLYIARKVLVTAFASNFLVQPCNMWQLASSTHCARYRRHIIISLSTVSRCYFALSNPATIVALKKKDLINSAQIQSCSMRNEPPEARRKILSTTKKISPTRFRTIDALHCETLDEQTVQMKGLVEEQKK